MKEGWSKRKLGEVCEIIMGQSPSSESYNEDGKGLPFYQGCSDFGPLYPKLKMFCSSPKKISEKQDILMSVRAPIGALNISNSKCCIGRGLAAIRCDDTLTCYKYVYYALYATKHNLQALGTGAVFKAINKDQLFSHLIPYPSLSEQQHIVSELDCLNGIIEKKKEQLKQLDELAQSIFYDMFGDPNSFSHLKEAVPLNSICEINPKKKEIEDLDRNLLCSFVGMSQVGEKGELALVDDRPIDDVWKGFTYFREKDVLFAKITPCMENGKGTIAKKLTNGIGFGSTEFHVIRPNEKILSEYIYYILSDKGIRILAENNMTGSAGQKRVPASFFKLKVLLPPIELQHQFAQKITAVEQQKKLIKQSLTETETLFNSRMDYYFG